VLSISRGRESQKVIHYPEIIRRVFTTAAFPLGNVVQIDNLLVSALIGDELRVIPQPSFCSLAKLALVDDFADSVLRRLWSTRRLDGLADSAFGIFHVGKMFADAPLCGDFLGTFLLDCGGRRMLRSGRRRSSTRLRCSRNRGVVVSTSTLVW